MDQWSGKIAVVVGASSGIGEAIAVALLEHGVNVVGLARRLENMKKLASDMEGAVGTFYPVCCDLRNEEDIVEAFRFIETLGGVNILVNSAGTGFLETLLESSTENMKTVLDVNVLGVAICTREAVNSLKDRGAEGHIIFINSVIGHNVILNTIPANLYEVSKFGITAMAEVLRREIRGLQIPVRVTSLSPGLVKTQMPLLQAAGGDAIFEMVPHLQRKDIADAVIYILGAPLYVQINELTITPLHSGILGA